MKIEQVTDISQVMEFLPIEQSIFKKGREIFSPRDMLSFIDSMLPNPLFRMYSAHDDEGNLVGYCAGIISPYEGMKKVIVLRVYAKDDEVLKAFENIVKDLAKEHKIKTLTMTMTKHIKAVQRKYKFVPVSVNLERRIV